MHRDLKPANIMVTSAGRLMVGDLGLARIFREPKLPLWNGDKVVVTIWYRAPELLLGGRHYTPAVDLWAIGCIFAELLSLRPIFKGEEAKMDNKKTVPFQRNQLQKILEVMGPINWPQLMQYPEYAQYITLLQSNTRFSRPPGSGGNGPAGLEAWYASTLRAAQYPPTATPGKEGFTLLSGLLECDPEKRLTAAQALEHPYFAEKPNDNCFEGTTFEYPKRKISQEDNSASLPGTKRSGLPDDTLIQRSVKRSRPH